MVNSQNIAILSEKVAALEAALKNAGIELPEVTSSDNGKALQVVNGVWATGIVIPTTSDAINYDNDTSVTQAIDEHDLNISDKFTLNSSTYSSLTGTVNAYYNRKTHKVYGTLGARATEAIPVTAEYFNIDSDYRPTATTNIPSLVIIGSGNVPSIYKAIIGTDGSVKQDLSNDSRGIYAYFEYYIN